MFKIPHTMKNIWVLEPEETIGEIPDPHFYFIQGLNVFLCRRNKFQTLVTSVDNPSSILKDVELYYDPKSIYLESSIWDDFKLRPTDLAKVMKYFRDIYAEQQTEAAVILMGHPENPLMEVIYLIQKNMSKAGVTYIMPHDDVPEEFKEQQTKILEEFNALAKRGYRVIGTIHSHSDFSAFHSGIDDHDEKTMDGIHITIGNVNTDFSFSARLMIEEVEFHKINIDQLIDNATIEEVIGMVSEAESLNIKDFIIPNKPMFSRIESTYFQGQRCIFNPDEVVTLVNEHGNKTIYVLRSFYENNKKMLSNYREQFPEPVQEVKSKKATNLLKKEIEDTALIFDLPMTNPHFSLDRPSTGFKFGRTHRG